MEFKLNLAFALRQVEASRDTTWLRRFREGVAGNPDGVTVVNAIDRRLCQLEELTFKKALGSPLTGNLTLQQRVHEAVRVYEVFLSRKHHGKRIRANRTRAMIDRWGAKEAVRRTVMNMDASTGLDTLFENDRLDCAYEQIIIDFPSEFGPDAVAKARANLARVTS